MFYLSNNDSFFRFIIYFFFDVLKLLEIVIIFGAGTENEQEILNSNYYYENFIFIYLTFSKQIGHK